MHPWGSPLLVIIDGDGKSPAFCTAARRSEPLASIAARALLPLSVSREPVRIPAFVARDESGDLVQLPVGVPIGPLADLMLGTRAGAQLLRLRACEGVDGGLVGPAASAATEVFTSLLGTSEALAKRHAARAQERSSTPRAATPRERRQSAEDAAVLGDSTLMPATPRGAPVLLRILIAGAPFTSRLAPQTAPLPWAVVARVFSSAHDAATAFDAALLAAIGAASCEGAPPTRDSHVAIVHGVDARAVAGFGDAPLGELRAGGLVGPEGWLWIALVRIVDSAGGEGRAELGEDAGADMSCESCASPRERSV